MIQDRNIKLKFFTLINNYNFWFYKNKINLKKNIIIAYIIFIYCYKLKIYCIKLANWWIYVENS